jgi:hypothetical protein
MPEAVNLGMGIFPLFPRQALHIITQFLFRARNNWGLDNWYEWRQLPRQSHRELSGSVILPSCACYGYNLHGFLQSFYNPCRMIFRPESAVP